MKKHLSKIYYKTNNDIKTHLDIILLADHYFQLGIQEIFEIEGINLQGFCLFSPFEELKKKYNKDLIEIIETRVSYDSDLYFKLSEGSYIVSEFTISNHGVLQNLKLIGSIEVSKDFNDYYNTLSVLKW